MATAVKGVQSKIEYEPTEAEIAEKCAEFRKRWTAKDWRIRWQYPRCRWSIPEPGQRFQEAVMERIGK